MTGDAIRPFDPTKPVRTRDGRPARIICTDRASHTWPIVALVGDGEDPFAYTVGGCYFASGTMSDHDLINIPERHVRWVNIYDRGAGEHDTRESADDAARGGPLRRIACIRIEFEEGEGLP